jgi:hypothetical protein
MKKILFSLCLLPALALAQTVVFEYGFNGLTNSATPPSTATNLPTGWTILNTSAPAGSTTWFDSTTFPAQEGAGYITANFNNTTGANPISTWLITPVVELVNGDVISFWTRTAAASQWADDLELRISTAGAGSTDPAGVTGVGSYTTLALNVNPGFPDPAGYPADWAEQTHTVAGLTGATNCRIAFRYHIPESGGPAGDNSNIIGVDDFKVTRTLSAEAFFGANFAMYPNPATSTINVSSKSEPISLIEITDINGRIVSTRSFSGASTVEMNVSELNAGVYFVEVTSENGKGTSKLIKK